MIQFPMACWQYPSIGDDVARFSLAPPEARVTTPLESASDPLESLRCDVIVELSNCLTEAAITYPRLAPFLMDGLDHALEALLNCKRQSELQLVRQWLRQEMGEDRGNEA